MNFDSVYGYFLLFGLFAYGALCVRFALCYRQLASNRWLLAALVLWPLTQVEEWLKNTGGVAEWSWLTGVFDFVPVAIATCLYKATKPLVTRHGPTRPILVWAPLLAAMGAQVALIVAPPDLKAAWVSNAPSGLPLTNWPVYLVTLLTGFSVLLFSIMATELIQNYHRFLPEQVVDTQLYRIRWLTGSFGTIVGVSFITILLVTAATFGFLTLPFWLSLFHLSISLILLWGLAVLIKPIQTSPSPVDYDRLQEAKIASATARDIVTKAEQLVIADKVYKVAGLRLETFAQQLAVNPTDLAISLHSQGYSSFRAFIFHYRLEYAKNVLLRSDAKMASVAKRLGLNSEKFLSDVLVKHLQKP